MVKDFLFNMLGYVGIILLIIFAIYSIIYFVVNILRTFKGLILMYSRVKKWSWLTSNLNKYLIIDIESKTIRENTEITEEEQIKILNETIEERKRLIKKCDEMKEFLSKRSKETIRKIK